MYCRDGRGARYNLKSDAAIAVVYGAVTTGGAWKFLQLRQNEVIVDIHEYYIVDVAKIMGVLAT